MNPLANVRLINAETLEQKIHVHRSLDQCGFGKRMAKGQGGRGRGVRLNAVQVLGAMGHQKNGSCLPPKEPDLVAYFKTRELGEQTPCRRRRAVGHDRHVFLNSRLGPLCVARPARGQSSSTSVGMEYAQSGPLAPGSWTEGGIPRSFGQKLDISRRISSLPGRRHVLVVVYLPHLKSKVEMPLMGGGSGRLSASVEARPLRLGRVSQLAASGGR